MNVRAVLEFLRIVIIDTALFLVLLAVLVFLVSFL